METHKGKEKERQKDKRSIDHIHQNYLAIHPLHSFYEIFKIIKTESAEHWPGFWFPAVRRFPWLRVREKKGLFDLQVILIHDVQPWE